MYLGLQLVFVIVTMCTCSHARSLFENGSGHYEQRYTIKLQSADKGTSTHLGILPDGQVTDISLLNKKYHHFGKF